jgi:hypothetical protein
MIQDPRESKHPWDIRTGEHFLFLHSEKFCDILTGSCENVIELNAEKSSMRFSL